MELFYTSAASYSTQTSNEALPIGNGKLAAMIYGGVSQEIIQFNEDTVWAGRPNDYSNPGASDWLDDIQNYIWLGEGQNAYNLAAADHFMSVPLRQSPYQPAGNLRLNFSHSGSNYRRSLDLETAIAKVAYTSGGVTYTREYFASFPDQVIVIRLTADQAGALSFNYTFDTQHTGKTVTTSGTDLILDAIVNRDVDTRRQQISEVEFQSRVRIVNEGGTVSASGSSVTVSNADAVTLIMSVATNFVRFDDLSADPAARVSTTLAAASGKNYASLLADHLADYQALFNRVVLDLNTTNRSTLPTNTRLGAVTSTSALDGDLQLVALNFQMGRYLMIAGSRPGSQPLTLQGKWNNEVNPAWESKMTLNINQEMNYWATEIANLPECHLPMVELVRDLTETGGTVATVHYGADGWMVHHNTDLWRGAAPINNPGGLWPTGGAWLSMHLWWHYQYTQDATFLADAYPLMKGAAEFFVDFLQVDPREGNEPYLLTNPTHSPEHPNPALNDDGELVAGTTMDNQLLRGLFSYVIEASEILDVDPDLRAELTTMRAQLPPNQIGRLGQLQEWLEDVDQAENPALGGHRHLSHMVGLFPGDEIHPLYEPELAAACKVVIDWKGDPTNNTSWSQAWKMCLRNALLDGDHAYMILSNILRTSHSENMTFSRKGGGSPENQIDGNFGATMGTAQFFLQNRRGEIHLLPALPTPMSAGSVAGLRAPGAFTIGIDWAGGELTRATVHSDRGNTCRIRVADPIHVVSGGTTIPVVEISTGLYEFSTSADTDYEVLPGAVAVVDTDHDGLSDAVETNTGIFVSASDTGSDPGDDDSDDDTLLDGDEVMIHGTDPNKADTDGDGLTDAAEINLHGTDALDDDDDDDGLLDGEEINTYLTDPKDADSDDDTLTDGDEVNLYNTLPNEPDSDFDTFDDAAEIAAGTNPRDPASKPLQVTITVVPDSAGTSTGDGVYLPNDAVDVSATAVVGYVFSYWEGASATFTDNPYTFTITADTALAANFSPDLSDGDSDGLTTYDEVFVHGTKPDDDDSDDDGLLDGEEVNTYSTLPNDDDSDDDTLLDGDEVNLYNTLPNKADSDNDGFDDAVEVAMGTDPRSETSHPVALSLSLNPAETGTVSGAGTFAPDASVAAEAMANPGYVFVQWSGDATSSANPHAFTITADTSLTATFGEDTSDADDDGLTAYQEIVLYGTLPGVKDTDGDGVNDGDEVAAGTNPLVDESGTLLLYEGFDYTAGEELLGQNGGHGWGGAWTGRPGGSGPTTGAVVQEGSLHYGDLKTSGGHLFMNAAGLSAALELARFPAETIDATAGESLYLSILAQRQGPTTTGTNPYPRGVTMRLFDTSNDERLNFGNRSGAAEDVWNVSAGSSQMNTDISYSAEVVFVVLRIDYTASGTADKIYFWVNPVLGAAEDIGSAFPLTNASGPWKLGDLGWLSPFVGHDRSGQPHGEIIYDELRLGTTYAAVTPIGPPLDTDDDGLSDVLETALAPLGFDPGTDSTALRTLLRENAPLLGYYTRGQLRAVATGHPVLEYDTANGGFFLEFKLLGSDDLELWTPLEFPPVAWLIQNPGVKLLPPASSNPAFYSVELIDNGVTAPSSLPTPDPTDTDGDGVGDSDETTLAALGFDAGVDSTVLLDLLEANRAALGLFTRSQLRMLMLELPMIGLRDPVGEVSIDLPMWTSEDGSSWTALTPAEGDMTTDGLSVRMQLPASAGVEFYDVITSP